MIRVKMYNEKGEEIHEQVYRNITNMKRGLAKRTDQITYVRIYDDEKRKYFFRILFNENIKDRTYKTYVLTGEYSTTRFKVEYI